MSGLEQNEYLEAVGKGAVMDLMGHHDDKESWALSKFSDGDVKVYTKKSGDAACPEDIVKAVTVLESMNTDQVLAMSMPWFPYRTQWDDLLIEGRTVLEISPACRLIHHLTRKKLPLSSRDSVDVVNVHCRGDTVFMSCRSVFFDGVPETKENVRTTTHLGGYVFRPVENGNIEFEMYFHADLKIGGLALMKSIVESIKPKFMVDLLKNLRKVCRKVAITPADLEATKIYTDMTVDC